MGYNFFIRNLRGMIFFLKLILRGTKIFITKIRGMKFFTEKIRGRKILPTP